MIRVTGGTHRGRILKTPPGEITRPALGSVRQAVFNILATVVPGSRFLDLFGGSGAFAIEAISRGADRAVIVDINRKAIAVIQENVEALSLGDQISVMYGDALRAIPQFCAAGKAFDIVAVAPPHFAGLVASAVKRLDEYPDLVAGEGVVFVQHHRDEPVPDGIASFELGRNYVYGITHVTLLHKR